MLKATVIITGFAVFFFILIGCAESAEIRFISPIGAAARSVIPGWGQVYTRSKVEGVIVFLSVGLFAGGGIRAHTIYRDFYDNKYRPAVFAGSDREDFYFDRANQYYKLSRFLIYVGAGIWAYSVLDAYVDAHIYNAQQQAEMLDIDDESLQQLKLEDGLSQVIIPKNGFLSSFCFSPVNYAIIKR